MSADLHLHSTASDGSDAPADVVRRVAAAGFTAMALADHDTMDGVAEAMDEAGRAGIRCIPAVEYSTLDDEREIHMLGYGLDPDDAALRKELRRLSAGRFNRAMLMVEKLNELGVSVTWERVQQIAGDENVGRPHVARAMQEAGYIREIKEAFTEEWIANGGRAYVERVKITPEESIAQIRSAGGVAVLAHPGRFRSDDDTIGDEVIERYIAAGLEGIEVFYSRHTPAMESHYRALSERHGLVMTGGSDDHGSNAEPLLGTIRLPDEYVTRLTAAIDASRRRRVPNVPAHA
jgi:predicted metal-dependent phosphoesterase TrpH